jgi:uncharacterized protein YkwD
MVLRLGRGFRLCRGHELTVRYHGQTYWRLIAAICASALLLVLLLPRPAAATSDLACGDSGRPPSSETLHQMRTSLLCLINDARRRHAMPPLSFNLSLRTAATGHSRAMVRHRFFSHWGSGAVSSRVTRAGYGAWSMVGENIGGGAGRRFGSPYAVFRDWMGDPEHRANILDGRFRDFGVGVWRGYPYGGGPQAATYTVDFARRG